MSETLGYHDSAISTEREDELIRKITVRMTEYSRNHRDSSVDNYSIRLGGLLMCIIQETSGGNFKLPSDTDRAGLYQIITEAANEFSNPHERTRFLTNILMHLSGSFVNWILDPL